jgi:hypothetical protein
MLMLPVSYRRSGRMPRDIIAREWPALLEWPVNQSIGAIRLLFRLRKLKWKAAKTFHNPELLLGWVRGIISGRMH